MQNYLEILKHVIDNGSDRPDRTGVGTRSVLGLQFRCDLQKGFPCLTTKKILWKSAIGEILWWLEGSGDERRLAEIINEKPRSELKNKKTVWTANANAPYWISKAKFEGDCGKIYGKQIRNWNGEIDQLTTILEQIKKDPYGRRHILTSWNPSDLNSMALPPCHYNVQFYISNNKLSSVLTMRSLDIFLGMPFDIIMYATLTHIIAKDCGYDVGEFVLNATDAHIYHNHFDAVNEQLSREPLKLPTLSFEQKPILGYKVSDFNLDDYNFHPAIKAPMAV